MADQDGFERWYLDAHPRLVKVLLVYCGGNVDVATDAVDEAMVRALEKWRRVQDMDSPEAWTYRVAVNVVSRRFRRRGGERRAMARTPPKPAWVDDGQPSALWDAVARLDEREAEALALRYLADMTEAEVAQALGMRVGGASSLLSRARKSLRIALEAAEDV